MIKILFRHVEDGRVVDEWLHADYGAPAIGDTVDLGDVNFTVVGRHWVLPNQVVVRVRFGTGAQQ